MSTECYNFFNVTKCEIKSISENLLKVAYLASHISASESSVGPYVLISPSLFILPVSYTLPVTSIASSYS